MNENTKLGIVIIISVVLSLGLTPTFFKPQKTVPGIQGEVGPQGIQGEQGPPGESIVGPPGPPGEGFSLSGTWKCIFDAGDHYIPDILEVEVTSSIVIVQWEYHDAVEHTRCFTITVRTLGGMEFKESSTAEHESSIMVLMGSGRYTILTHSNHLGGVTASVKIYELMMMP